MSDVFLVSGNAGQGKTTVAKNIAFALTTWGYDVLLVDADMKTPKVGHHVGMPLVDRSIQHVLRERISLEDAIYRTQSGLKLLLSSLSFVECPHPSALLPQLKKYADVVIIDVPTGDERWYRTGEKLILVSQPDFPSVLEINKIARRTRVHGLILNRTYNDGIDLSAGNISEILSVPLLAFIPEELRMREALRHGYSIVEFHPELEASSILKHIAAKLMNLDYTSPIRRVSMLEKLGLVQ